MTRVLVVDDEKLIVKGIRFSLEQDGMKVDCAYDGEEAIELAKQNEYDMILLDVMLPKHDGFEVCQTIREFSEVPIIMLTARGGDMDKILGLDYGADDYITKPFNILEVKARIKAILRRNQKNQVRSLQEQQKTVTAGDMKLDIDGRRVFIGNREINRLPAIPATSTRNGASGIISGYPENERHADHSGQPEGKILEGCLRRVCEAAFRLLPADGY